MAEFRLFCRTCAFEHEADSLDDALRVELDHKKQHGDAHEVTIERRRRS